MKKLFLIAITSMALFSCSKSDVTGIISDSQAELGGRDGDPTGGCEPVSTTVDLMAGQTQIAGTVTAESDGTNLLVTYTTNELWSLEDIHLYVGEFELAPQNNGGNPMPGRFPYKQQFADPVSTFSYEIPLSSLPDCFIIAAHAVVRKTGSGTETGWGAGTQFPGNNWGMYFEMCAPDCL